VEIGFLSPNVPKNTQLLGFWDVSNNNIQQEYDTDMNHNKKGIPKIPIHQEQSVCQQK